jgi:hypothetical protein
MKKMIVAAAALLVTATMASTRADAFGPGGAASLAGSADSVALTESVQFLYGGRRHCWYPDGWNGPGWYWCGYGVRRGLGWGGGEGFQGWSYGVRRGPVMVAPVVVAPMVRGPVVVAPRVRGPVVVAPRRGPQGGPQGGTLGGH